MIARFISDRPLFSRANHQFQRERFAQRRAQGVLRLVRTAARRRALRAGARGARYQLADRASRLAAFIACPRRAEARIQRRGDLLAQEPAAVQSRHRRAGVRCGRPLPRGAFRLGGDRERVFPSGSAGPARQEAKFRFLAAFDKRLADLRSHHVPFVFCGDFNMAHRAIDLRNWRANQDYPRIHAAGARVARHAVRRPRIRGRVSRGESRSRINTPGGPTAAAPGTRTSVGASITKS